MFSFIMRYGLIKFNQLSRLKFKCGICKHYLPEKQIETTHCFLILKSLILHKNLFPKY